MNATDVVNILQSAIGLIFAVFIVFRLWPVAHLAAFRQEIFAIRDELFDYAASGGIDFHEPTYRLLRRSMNGYIRYAHRLTFFQLVMTLTGWKVSGNVPRLQWVSVWDQAVKDIANEEVRTKIQEFHSRALSAAAKRILLGSPVLVLFVLIYVLAALCNSGWQNLRQLVKSSTFAVLEGFMDVRQIEEEAARHAVA